MNLLHHSFLARAIVKLLIDVDCNDAACKLRGVASSDGEPNASDDTDVSAEVVFNCRRNAPLVYRRKSYFVGNSGC